MSVTTHRVFRLAYLVSHPIQYQAPLLRYIARDPAIDLHVLFLSDRSVDMYRDPGFGVDIKWDVALLDGYEHSFLPTLRKTDKTTFWQPFVYGLWSRLKGGRFDALWVHGYSHQANLRAFAIAKILGLQVFLRTEATLRAKEKPRLDSWLKEKFLRILYRNTDAFLAIGTLNRRHYLSYGVPEDRIFMMPYAVDNKLFMDGAEAARANHMDLRDELHLEPDRPVILFVSKLIGRKRPGDLLRAYERLATSDGEEPWPYLVYVGTGEEEARLEKRANLSGWSSIRFLGFKNQTELPRYYELCDVFVLPSEFETWGLVVNEAMAAGKPVIVTEGVGCGSNLVRDGENGYVVPVGDISLLADRIDRLTSDSALARRMGESSRRRILTWSFKQDLSGLQAALSTLVR